MPFDASVRAYLRAYQNEYRAALHGGQHTAELSFRVPMHEMFRRIAHDLNPAGTFDIILEPRNQGRMGRPDWRIQDRISLGVYGYIEAKGPSNEPFDTTPYRDQINRYLTLGHMLIDKIAEEHRHKSRYSTGEAIGRASKSRGRATTCAANDKTVTNISSDCTSHQEKDTAGSTHGKIPVKGGRIAAAIPPDAEHRYKINRNNNDDRSQHSDFLSFLHHAEAQ